MSQGILKYMSSSIGRKYIMAVSGLVWVLFVLTHMIGNLLIFAGKDAYNVYSHKLITNPLIYLAEAALVIFIGAHAFTGISLKLRNNRTKPTLYAVTPKSAKGASLSSKSMIWSGTITLVFLILHLVTFKYGQYYAYSKDGADVVLDGIKVRDIHQLVIECFEKPGYVAWYGICLVLVGLHLYHGVASSFQTLGLNHPKFNNAIKMFGWAYAIVVALGFLAVPLYVFIF
ncbi:MAG: cytochrome B subunit [Proteobacteria bacterium]|nr:cytochrome B subunit [Pseudomonadota bacterium]